MKAEQAGSGASLHALFSDTGVEAMTGMPDIKVTDITADSSRVTAGGLFLACRGLRRHGIEFAADAIAAGAAAIAWEPEETKALPALAEGVACFAVPGLGEQVGNIADRFFAEPSAALDVIGVTGTNGKTTVAWLAAQALNKLGNTAGYMGTLGFGTGAQLEPSALTTPGVIAVHRRLRQLADAGAATVVMEVSSHGLDQGRIDAVRIRTAAFTNLSRDHLDYHNSIADYRAAKASLFALPSVETAVINIGDPVGAELAGELQDRLRVIGIALAGDQPAGLRPALTAEVTETGSAGLSLHIDGDFGAAELHSSLWGRFNAENLLMVSGLLLAQGYLLDDVIAALAECTAPPGRMQVLRATAEQPLVVVDFAHTPDALAKALQVVREHCDGRVTVVFGCGGDRDTGKRGDMGAVAARLADRVIVTDDNPRNELPEVITAAIIAGISDDAAVSVVHDRAAAINTAVRESGAADAVLIAGKGDESYQLVGSGAVPFSDAETAVQALGGCV